jgi:ribosomal-protein-alanine N-acetyltransferase
MYALDRVCFTAPFRFSLAMLRRLFTSPGQWTLLAAMPDGSLVGFVMVELGEPSYLSTLDVDPRLRRSGVGTRLIQAAERYAVGQGSTAMALHVSTGNEGAVRFYEARGYVRLGLERRFYGRGLDAFLYGRRLRA